MKRLSLALGAVALAVLTLAQAAAASEVKLVGVTYPEGKKISLPFARTDIAPKAATLEGTVRMEKGQAEVRIKWEKMEPAVLFAGNITSYAVWAVTRDGRPENLGELPVREKKSGEASFRTGKVNFGLMVTAEVLPGGVLPTELVLFTSGKVDEKTTAKNWDFTIDGTNPFRELVRPGNPSIADLSYAAKHGEPIELQQARKAFEMAEMVKASTIAPKEMEVAKSQLAQAQNSTQSGGSAKAVVDYARRSLENSGTAARLKVQAMLEEKLAAEDAARKAAEERKRQELEATKARANAAEAEKARLAADVARLKAEQEQLKAGLQDALGKIMAVQESARGVVLNMGDILFDVNKSTLKKDAEYAVVKLSAILSVFPKLQVRAEGFTDSTGKEELNMKLSAERARTVADFLIAQGVAKERLTHAGYGPSNAVGDNATAEGRAKNRRVELILNQGAIAPTPGGMVAPEKPAKPAAKK
jgi:outer membrane protein OmpA-like peptidoglycan-associated protein